MSMNENDLISRGFIQHPDGSWQKPCRRLVREMEAHGPKPTSLPTLERGQQKQPRGKESLARIQLISCRRRLLDPDAVAFSMKPLTDAIAATLGVDDADPCIDWEWSQLKTNSSEGVIVKMEML